MDVPSSDPPPAFAVAVLSDDDDDDDAAISSDPAFCSPLLPCPKKRRNMDQVGGGLPFPTLLVIDDDPTPQKPNPTCTPSFVPETPQFPVIAFDSSPSVVKCSLARAKLAEGISGVICLESDNESEPDLCMMNAVTSISMSRAAEQSQLCLSSHIHENRKGAGVEEDCSLFSFPDAILNNYNKNDSDLLNDGTETSSFIQIAGDSQPHTRSVVEETLWQENALKKADVPAKQKKKGDAIERKRQRQQEKSQKESLKAEAAEAKKLEKQRKKRGNGKFAIRSMVAEIDAKVVENGSVGGHLLTRFAEKGLSFRITSNPIQRSILWKMNIPDEIAELPSRVTDVPYILIIYQAEEFCDLVDNKSLFDNVHMVQSQYPTYTICYLTNKLMRYINKCEQTQYKNPLNASSWIRPPIEEVLSKLATHYLKVHSKQCIDEAELAETVVGLTCSLANCQSRKKLTGLSVHANGSIIPNNFAEKNLIKKNVWLRALITIPKVQPRHAIAIWKKYPTMRSLLNVYMDGGRSVHEKEFLLKDLMVEGLLGKEDTRLGEICSKRVYRILMARAGGITTDDAEEGADFFHR